MAMPPAQVERSIANSIRSIMGRRFALRVRLLTMAGGPGIDDSISSRSLSLRCRFAIRAAIVRITAERAGFGLWSQVVSMIACLVLVALQSFST